MRDYYKNVAFDIIKIRLNINYYKLYFTINEIILKLNVIFEIYDKVIKLNVKFYDLNFAINIKNKKKSFEIFYVRFNVIIIF